MTLQLGIDTAQWVAIVFANLAMLAHVRSKHGKAGR